MAQCYVIRDKNTGLYFRGKGVNRWGKHYNQASIYRVKGSAEHTIKEISWHGEQAEIVPIQIVETSADVAPKSEGVDRWRLQLEAVLEEIPETKREIAMETFDEIGNAMCKTYNAVQLDAHLWHMYAYMDDHSLTGWEKGSYLQGMKRMIDVVRELKKKYTEETNP